MSTRQRLQAVLARRRWLRWTLLAGLTLIVVALALVLVDALHREPAPLPSAPAQPPTVIILEREGR